MPLRRPILVSLLLSGAFAAPVPALAGGFYLQEQAPKETGRAMAGAGAAADDPSAIYFNHTALTQLPGLQTSVGGIASLASADRKRVVCGTSLSERVDIGGRRIIQQK